MKRAPADICKIALARHGRAIAACQDWARAAPPSPYGDVPGVELDLPECRQAPIAARLDPSPVALTADAFTRAPAMPSRPAPSDAPPANASQRGPA